MWQRVTRVAPTDHRPSFPLKTFHPGTFCYTTSIICGWARSSQSGTCLRACRGTTDVRSRLDEAAAHRQTSVVITLSDSVRISQQAHRDSLLRANEAVIRRIRDAVSSVPPDTLTRRPVSGGWSVAEVLEHLIISADSYLDLVRRSTRENASARADATATWKPSLMGGMLTESLRNPRKLPAPGMYKPGPTPRAGVLDEFLRRQEEVGRLIIDAGDLDWRHVRMRSPVLPIIRMNLGDALTIPVVHAERHAAQIERVLKASGE